MKFFSQNTLRWVWNNPELISYLKEYLLKNATKKRMFPKNSFDIYTNQKQTISWVKLFPGALFLK